MTGETIRLVKEPTLIFDSDLCTRNIGFTSPWSVRIRLFWMAVFGKVRAVEMRSAAGVVVKGWVTDSGTQFVTRVRVYDA